MESFIYILYVVFASTAILTSILKYKNLFHPQTLIVIITVALFMSDFIISGYSERVLRYYSFYDIQWHQMTILFVCCAIILMTYLLASHIGAEKYQQINMTDLTWSARGVIPWVAFSIIIIDILKRLYFAEWSPLDAIMLSIGPRGSAPWNIKGGEIGNLGDENFIFGITTILMPFSFLTMYCRYISLKGIKKIVAFVFIVVSLFAMIFDGTRTPVVFVIAMSSIIYYYNSESSSKLIKAISVAVLMIVVLTSFMYLFRSEGYTYLD
jgi:oligosaccharide repeat unit polymerase